MNAPTPTYAFPNELSHLQARRAFRTTDSKTPSKDACDAQDRYAADVNALGAELLALGFDRKLVDKEIERFAGNWIDRYGKYLSAMGKPEAEEKLADFNTWRGRATAAILSNLGGAVGQFEPIIEKRDLSLYINEEAKLARLAFVERPEPEVREGLKASGWKWQAVPQAWEAPIGQVDAVKDLLGLGGHAAKENGRRAAAGKRGRA